MSKEKEAVLDGPFLPAASGAAKRLVVFCHGYGADGRDLIGLAPYWQKFLPDAAFVAPNAPMRCDMNPMGYQWFPISHGDRAAAAMGVRAASVALRAFLDAQRARFGIDEGRMALVGFSQGTMMVLHVGLRLGAAPAAIVGFSGALADPESLKRDRIVKPPILLVHGDSDAMISPMATESAAKVLEAAGLEVRWHISMGTGHSIGLDGMELGGLFLRRAFGGGAS